MHVCLCECKCCKNSSLLWLIFMQVASTEWFLGVQIQNYKNLYNVEIINGMYCCCDDNETCGSAPNDLLAMCKDPNTVQLCETYFLVHIKNCLSLSTCSLSKTYQLNYGPSSSISDHGIVSIPFMEMELGDEVRAKMSYFRNLMEKLRKLAINMHFSFWRITFKLCSTNHRFLIIVFVLNVK